LINATEGAKAQGQTRFDRGLNYFVTARRHARDLNLPFCWSLKTVPITGHYNKRMAMVAARELFSQ
jgi:hypothetical protein